MKAASTLKTKVDGNHQMSPRVRLLRDHTTKEWVCTLRVVIHMKMENLVSKLIMGPVRAD